MSSPVSGALVGWIEFLGAGWFSLHLAALGWLGLPHIMSVLRLSCCSVESGLLENECTRKSRRKLQVFF